MEQMTFSQTLAVPYAISPDAKMLLVGIAGGTRIGVLPLDGTREIRTLMDVPGAQSNADLSPNGHWLAYQSSESGAFEIYVRPFPNVEAGRWQVSSGGGIKPLWARSGQELFYLAASDTSMTSVPVRTSPSFSFGAPVRLFEGRYFAGPPGRTYDVSSDGKRFLMIKSAATERAAANTSVVVVLNWLEELNQRLAVK